MFQAKQMQQLSDPSKFPTNKGNVISFSESITNCKLHSKPYTFYKTNFIKKHWYCYDCLIEEEKKPPSSNPTNWPISWVPAESTDSYHKFITTANWKKIYFQELQSWSDLIVKGNFKDTWTNKTLLFEHQVASFINLQTKLIIDEILMKNYQQCLSTFVNSKSANLDINNIINFLSDCEKSKFDIQTRQIFAMNQLKHLQEKFIYHKDEWVDKIKKTMNEFFLEELVGNKDDNKTSFKKEMDNWLDIENVKLHEQVNKELEDLNISLPTTPKKVPKRPEIKSEQTLEKESIQSKSEESISVSDWEVDINEDLSDAGAYISDPEQTKDNNVTEVKLIENSEVGEKNRNRIKDILSQFNKNKNKGTHYNQNSKKPNTKQPYNNKGSVNNKGDNDNGYTCNKKQFNKNSSYVPNQIINTNNDTRYTLYNDFITRDCSDCQQSFTLTQLEQRWKWRCKECQYKFNCLKKKPLSNKNKNNSNNNNNNKGGSSVTEESEGECNNISDQTKYKPKQIDLVCTECKTLFSVSQALARKRKKCFTCFKEENEKNQ